MVWRSNKLVRMAGKISLLAFGITAALSAHKAAAQKVGDPFPCNLNSFYTGTSANDYLLTLCNNYLAVTVGIGQNQGGSIGLYTDISANDASDTIAPYYPTAATKLTDPTTLASFTAYVGSHVFLRVDGGTGNGGADYIVGTYNTALGGTWLSAPQLVGSHIEASWETLPITTTTGGTGGGGTGGGGTGGGTTSTFNPQIEVNIKIVPIHSTMRFEFDIVNLDNHSHTVALGFLQSIEGSITGQYIGEIGTPIVVPNGPYIHHEVSLTGGQVPATYETVSQISPPTNTSNGVYRTIEAILKPQTSTTTEPTPPTRLIVGNLLEMEGNLNGNAVTPRLWNQFWEYDQPQPITGQVLLTPTQPIDGNSPVESAGVGIYWDNQAIAPGQTIPIITYLGDASSSIDIGQPMTLTVSSPQTLPVSPFNGASGGTVSPSPFTISAYVQNISDLQQQPGFTITPVNLSITLPAGLTLAAGDTVNKQVNVLSPETQQSVSWQVVPDGTHIGPLTYTVTAQPGLGSGRIVQRTIEVPAPVSLTLKGSNTSQGKYQMITVPLQTKLDTPTTVLFPGVPANQARIFGPLIYDNNILSYNSVNTFVPGQAYWIKSILTQDTTVNFDLTKYAPLQTTTQYSLQLQNSWNQIGDPYVYGVNFGEATIFDTSTQKTYTVAQASDPTVHLLLPIAFYYNTTDPNPANWAYSETSNLTFDMIPFQGYFIQALKQGLILTFNGVTTPGSTILGKAVPFAPSITTAAVNNWQLHLSASASDGTDNLDVIGIAPNATDRADFYKYPKPPMINNQLSMNIVHPTWTGTPQYGQDIRSAALNAKTWDLQVHSVVPNESVSVAWANIAHQVPHTWNLSIVDPSTGNTVNMRTRSSYQVQTDKNGLASLQITAVPSGSTVRPQILAFTVNGPSRAVAGTLLPVSVNYSVAGSGNVELLIRDAHGQVIRSIQPTTRATATGATGTAIWDMKNNQGVVAPTGVYTLELNIVSSDGQQTRRALPLVVSR